MKKYLGILLLATAVFTNSCSESELELYPPYNDIIGVQDIDTELKLQQFLNGAYILSSNSNAFGAEIMMFGDLLGDKLYVTNSNASYLTTLNKNYNSVQNEFGFYRTLYDVIMNCNMVINNTKVAENANVLRMKDEARVIRAFSYFTLVNYYSAAPTSGVNQELGVPLILDQYDVTVQAPRATVAEVYNQIVTDLQDSMDNLVESPAHKSLFSKTAAKLLLAKVYLTRRSGTDAQSALQLTTEIVNNQNEVFAPIERTKYAGYFNSSNPAVIENQPETIWELDVNSETVRFNGIGSNLSLPAYYDRTDSRKSFLFMRSFYDSFPSTDVRRGNGAGGLLTLVGVPTVDSPTGAWTNKHLRFTSEGNYLKNVKILRFADAQLSRIEALYLTGDTATALAELNAFATSRGGSTYSGANLLKDILDERAKEFYAEGQRFLDLKRYNQPIEKATNCIMNCSVPANDKLFVLPLSQATLNNNPNLVQYPGYN